MSDTVVEGLVLLRIVWFTAAKVLCTFLTNRTAKLSSWLKNASTGRGLLSPFLLVGNSVRLTPLFKAFHRSRMGWTSKCQSLFMCSFVPMRPMLTPIFSIYIIYSIRILIEYYKDDVFFMHFITIWFLCLNDYCTLFYEYSLILKLVFWNLCKYNNILFLMLI